MLVLFTCFLILATESGFGEDSPGLKPHGTFVKVCEICTLLHYVTRFASLVAVGL